VSGKMDPKEWSDDFQFFLDSPKINPPPYIGEEIFRIVHRDLRPTLSLIVAKLGGIHIFVGSLSLLLCSQFGMGRGFNLMHVFMDYGTFSCMTVCGALFLGFSTLVAGFMLSQQELAKIRKTCYAPIVLLGTASLVVFFCFGAEMALTLALMWLFGAVVAGALALEAGFQFKRYGVLVS
jgi:hypothetical protein